MRGGVEQAALVGESGAVGHVDGDGVAMTERSSWDKLVEGRPRVSISNYAVETDLVKVGTLEFEHLVNAFAIDLHMHHIIRSLMWSKAKDFSEVTHVIGSLSQFIRRAISPGKLGLNKILAVFVQKVEHLWMRARRDFDELREAVAHLSRGQCPQEREIQERVDGCVISAQPVLVVAVIDGYFDAHTGVNEPDDRGWHPDEVGVTAISCTGEAGREQSQPSVERRGFMT